MNLIDALFCVDKCLINYEIKYAIFGILWLLQMTTRESSQFMCFYKKIFNQPERHFARTYIPETFNWI